MQNTSNLHYVEGGNGVWPRAIIYDLYCDTSGVTKTPEFAYEYPEYTYRCKSIVSLIKFY